MKLNPLLWNAAGLRKLMRDGSRMRPLMGRLPSGTRCKGCWAPFEGLFAVPFQLMKVRPSRKSPNMCTI